MESKAGEVPGQTPNALPDKGLLPIGPSQRSPTQERQERGPSGEQRGDPRAHTVGQETFVRQVVRLNTSLSGEHGDSLAGFGERAWGRQDYLEVRGVREW